MALSPAHRLKHLFLLPKIALGGFIITGSKVAWPLQTIRSYFLNNFLAGPEDSAEKLQKVDTLLGFWMKLEAKKVSCDVMPEGFG
jgi:hypothetical protein